MEQNKNALADKLFFKAKNCFDVMTESDLAKAADYAKGYIDFLNNSKTERGAVKYSVALAEKNGFKEYRFGDSIDKNGKYYYNNRGKALYLFCIGSDDITETGIRITSAHLDSPRLDLKQHPLYEDSEFSYFKTHYYGGIKKYQWLTIPLALHGTVVREDGTSVDICIGDEEDDPVFTVTDLLPHLASEQMSKSMAAGVSGENMHILLGSRPYGDSSVSDRVKLKTMEILNEKYGITEADLMSAELSAVPAAKAKYVGFDRSFIGAYGHDDKVCAYPELTALFEAEAPKHTLLVVLADKEETGSNGVTGMQTRTFMDVFSAICRSQNADEAAVRAVSMCVSADVSAAYDPLYGEVYDKKNAAYVNYGVVMNKYTGARGKSGTSDASAEYVGEIRRILDNANVVWQTAELGKVDAGGGGTVAMYIAREGIDTLDLGVPVLSMHAPYETISVNDLYMTHLALAAFNS